MMALVYRMHTTEDEEPLRQLWSAETGWGEITSKQWRDWYIDTPLGEAAIAVAEDRDTGKIVGQLIFMPFRVCIQGGEVPAFRAYSPIVSKEYFARQRISNPLKHPVTEMYLHAVGALFQRGARMIYTLPNPRWQRFLEMFPELICGSYPLYSLSLPLSSPLPQ